MVHPAEALPDLLLMSGRVLRVDASPRKGSPDTHRLHLLSRLHVTDPLLAVFYPQMCFYLFLALLSSYLYSSSMVLDSIAAACIRLPVLNQQSAFSSIEHPRR